MPACVSKEALASLIELHQEYLGEYESIACSLMQNVPSHEYFENWLIETDNYEHNNILSRLQEIGLHIGSSVCESVFFDEDGNTVEIA